MPRILAQQSELERLQSNIQMLAKIDPTSSNTNIPLLKKNIEACVDFQKKAQQITKLGDFSSRLLIDSFLPNFWGTALNFGLEQSKESALEIINLKLIDCVSQEIVTAAYSQTGTVNWSPYQLEPILRTAIMTVGEPSGASEYLTFKLADLSAQWAKANAIQTETIIDNVGLLGKQVKINVDALKTFQKEVKTEINTLTTQLGGIEEATRQQQEALQALRGKFTDLAEYVKVEILKTNNTLSHEIKDRVESDEHLKQQVGAIRDALQLERDQQATEAGFNGAKQIGYFISELGQMNHAPALIYAGQALSASAQISQGITQLTGTVIPALSMLAPIASIAMGGMALYSLFSQRGDRGSDPLAIFLQQFSARFEERFNHLEQSLSDAFNQLEQQLGEMEKHIVQSIQQSQQVVINQVRVITEAATQKLSEKFEQGFVTSANLMYFLHTASDDKLTQLLVASLETTANYVETHDYEDDYFTDMQKEEFRSLRFALTDWALTKAFLPVVTGYHLVEPLSRLKPESSLDFNQRVIRADPTFMIGYLLNNNDIANPFIWLRAVRAYIKLAIARPDMFPDATAVQKEADQLKLIGESIIQHIKSTLAAIQTYQPYDFKNLRDKNTEDTQFIESLISHLDTRFNALIVQIFPKNDLERLKWVASYITNIRNSCVWEGKAIDFSKIDTEEKLYRALPYELKPILMKELKRLFFSEERPFIDQADKAFVPPILILLVHLNLVTFNIKISTGPSAFSPSKITISLNDMTIVECSAVYVHGTFAPEMLYRVTQPAFNLIQTNLNLLLSLDQIFCRWFNEHFITTLKDLLMMESDPILNPPSLSGEDKLGLTNNRNVARLWLNTNTHLRYIQQLKACYPYLQKYFEQLPHKDISSWLWENCVTLRALQVPIKDNQFEATSTLSAGEQISRVEYYKEGDQLQLNDFISYLNGLHDSMAYILVHGFIISLQKQFVPLQSISLSIDQEIEYTLTLLNHLPQYVNTRLSRKEFSHEDTIIDRANEQPTSSTPIFTASTNQPEARLNIASSGVVPFTLTTE